MFKLVLFIFETGKIKTCYNRLNQFCILFMDSNIKNNECNTVPWIDGSRQTRCTKDVKLLLFERN